MTTTLMSSQFRDAIQRLSLKRRDSKSKILINHGASHMPGGLLGRFKSRPGDITINDFRRVTGADHQRQIILKACGIPGWKLCTWMMDAPITKHWQKRAETLAQSLGLSISKAFDKEEDGN